MSESLALRWRPRNFADVVGQPPVVAVLYRMAYTRSINTALLLQGYRGAGKTSTARIVAAALNCELEKGAPGEWPCAQCPSCKAVANGTSLDVMEIDAASNGGVAEVERIRDRLQYHSGGGNYTVVLLDEVQSMSRPAFNTILKMLEEPPPQVIFALLTTDVARVLPTVVSRCMPFTFRRLPAGIITQRLEYICQQDSIRHEPALLRRIAERADGAMRDAVMVLDQVANMGIWDLAHYEALMGDTDFAPGLVMAMAAGNHAQLFERLEAVLTQNADYEAITSRLVACLRDLLVLLGKGTITAEGESLAQRRSLAMDLDAPRVAAALQVLWTLRTRTARTDPRASLELAVAMCLEKLHPMRAPHVSPGTGLGGSTPMDITMLRSMT
jgi:DNA polymerase III subunit gamma/tau